MTETICPNCGAHASFEHDYNDCISFLREEQARDHVTLSLLQDEVGHLRTTLYALHPGLEAPKPSATINVVEEESRTEEGLFALTQWFIRVNDGWVRPHVLMSRNIPGYTLGVPEDGRGLLDRPSGVAWRHSIQAAVPVGTRVRRKYMAPDRERWRDFKHAQCPMHPPVLTEFVVQPNGSLKPVFENPPTASSSPPELPVSPEQAAANVAAIVAALDEQPVASAPPTSDTPESRDP